MEFLIKVPATTANLGPGFDCLGLTLDLWNDVIVSTNKSGHKIQIEGVGADQLPQDENNAIFSSMKSYADHFNKKLPESISIKCVNRIPLGSGLGSSAAAVVAGILCATAILSLETDIEDQINFATQIEGHPDNVTPCLNGGFVASILSGEKVIYRQLPFKPFDILLVHPFFAFPTSVARKAIPLKISHQDAVFNLSHSILAVEAFRTGDLELLRTSLQDKLHQPYRLPLIPGANEAIDAAKKAGAVATILSGAGPTLLSFVPDAAHRTEIANEIQKQFAENGLQSEVFYPNLSASGAMTKKIIN